MPRTSNHRTRTTLVAAVAAALIAAGGGGSASASSASATIGSTASTTTLPRTSAWTADVTRAPLSPASKAMVANLDRQVTSHWGGVASLNVWNYNTSVYRVGSSQKRVDVRFDDCQGKGHTPRTLYGTEGHFEDVPIPADAVPASGRDRQLTVYSPSSDQLWEFWRAKRDKSGWSACWGGRIDHVSRSAGYFPSGMGASASGLATSLGAVGIEEAETGRIDHAISLAIPKVATWQSYSYPAQRSDGWDRQSAAIPMGTRFRLNPDVDVDALDLHPVAASIAKAAQRYGFVVSDSSGSVAVSTESGNAEKARTGSNPWDGILGRTGSYAVMEGFPWHRLQAVEEDWGNPVG